MKIRYWRKFLKRLEEITNVEAIELCDSLGLTRLSNNYFTRQSRAVYALNDHYVIKIARNKVGAEQNQHEIDVFNLTDPKDRKYFARLELDVSTYRYVVMEKVTTFKEDGKGLYSISQSKEFKFHREHSSRLQSEYFSDLCKSNNIGKRNGKIVVLDYGFSSTADKFYAETRTGPRWKTRSALKRNFRLQIV